MYVKSSLSLSFPSFLPLSHSLFLSPASLPSPSLVCLSWLFSLFFCYLRSLDWLSEQVPQVLPFLPSSPLAPCPCPSLLLPLPLPFLSTLELVLTYCLAIHLWYRDRNWSSLRWKIGKSSSSFFFSPPFKSFFPLLLLFIHLLFIKVSPLANIIYNALPVNGVFYGVSASVRQVCFTLPPLPPASLSSLSPSPLFPPYSPPPLFSLSLLHPPPTTFFPSLPPSSFLINVSREYHNSKHAWNKLDSKLMSSPSPPSSSLILSWNMAAMIVCSLYAPSWHRLDIYIYIYIFIFFLYILLLFIFCILSSLMS